ncbi:MAG: hypothetical protein MZV49_15830 [Rhodopseudomonas palustris]|nr:hypothetical protein [Rhodopseudomonas palustris]
MLPRAPPTSLNWSRRRSPKRRLSSRDRGCWKTCRGPGRRDPAAAETPAEAPAAKWRPSRWLKLPPKRFATEAPVTEASVTEAPAADGAEPVAAEGEQPRGRRRCAR